MYGKLFAQMYDGTLGTKGPWQALVTFQQLIILADKNGIVDLTPEALSRRTTIPLDVITVGLAELEKPDPQSRTPDEGGRRIVRLSRNRDWGWRVVNVPHYRKIRSEEERREYHKLYARKRRAKAAVNQNVNTSTASQQNQPIAVSSKQYVVRTKKEITTPAPTVADIAKHSNGKKPKADSDFGFMSELRPIWQEVYGGEIPPGSAKRLKPSIDKHGAEELARRLRIYCVATPAPFASIPKFISTFGAWDKTGTTSSTSKTLTAGQEATVDQLYKVCARGGVFSAMAGKDFEERCASIAETGEFTSDEVAALTRLDLPFCNNACQKNDRAALKRHIASLLFSRPAPEQPRQQQANGKPHRPTTQFISQ